MIGIRSGFNLGASVLLAVATAPTSAATLVVDQNSRSARQDGTASAPFRTIQQAAAVAVAGDTVAIHGGIYRETVRPAHSGRPGAPIVFEPVGKETVVLNGAAPVASSWTDDGGGMYSTAWPGAYVSAINQSDAVFADGVMLNLARWPEETNHDLSHPHVGIVAGNVSTKDTGKTEPGPGYKIFETVIRDPGFDEPDGRWKGAQVWISTGGATDSQDGDGITGMVVDTRRADHTLTIEVPATGPLGTAVMDASKAYQIGAGSHYYLFHPPGVDGLRHNGEWWHDTVRNRLYVRMPGGDAPARHRVEVKQRDWGFDLDGKAFVTVRNVGLFACSITTDDAAGNGKGNGGNRTGIAPAHHIILDGLQAKYVTHFTDLSGNVQTQWGQSSGIIVSGSDNVIRNSTVVWSAGSGITLMGRDSRAINNLVHDVTYQNVDAGGISLGAQYGGGDSLDNEVAYNTVYNTAIDGIEIGALRNSNLDRPGIAHIHHNIIHDAVLQNADSGGIHEVGHDGQWVRLDHNIIYSIGGNRDSGLYSGIYLDFAPENGRLPGRYIVDHNVIYATPLPLQVNGPNSDVFTNNTLMDTSRRQGPIQAIGGGFEKTIIRNNLANDPFQGVQPAAIQDHNIAAATPDFFVDAVNPDLGKRNYQLKAGATAAIDRGVLVLFNDALPPDIGAYEFGHPWRAGYSAAGAPQSTAGTVPTDAARPAANASRPGAVFPEGSFERLDPVGDPTGWNWTPYGNVSLAHEPNGNHFLRITHELPDRTVQAHARLPLDPAWKMLTASARMKVSGLQMGPAPNLTAAVVLRFMDKDGKLLGYAPSLTLIKDTDWTTVTRTFNIPAGADHLDIEVSNIGKGGDFGTDDLTFVPSPST